ncbi:Multi antimicrobial extrusion protein [Sesbania bispinosa]|nr:Multi antimicrobial extrusion protein [Sesbania bispinosa]
MAHKLSLHLHRTFHTSPLRNPFPSPTYSNHYSPLHFFTPSLLKHATVPSNQCLTASIRRRIGFVTARVARDHNLTDESEDIDQMSEGSDEAENKELAEQSLWVQMKEIVKFTGPAAGLWLCGPLMSLIDTAVVGQGSSVELAALVATSNMVATALAKQDREEVQHHISVLLFVGLACGLMMLLFTRLFGAATLTAFTGPKNVHVVPAANTYAQIRGLAWPALLVGSVAQSASLGMKDSWGPLKALAAASVINGIGDILLCSCLGYGIAGAAWATLASQVVAAYMMIQTLNKKGYDALAFSIPSGKEFLTILGHAAPVYLTSISKVAFFSLLIYVATSMGTQTMAAHQVMIQIYMACTVWGEPLCQTAQSFMPELMYGVNQSLAKARMLLRSLVIIGAILGLLLGIVGTSLLWLFPYIFTPDQMVIQKMHRTLIPFFVALAVTPPTRSLEGTLLAGHDLRFISLSTCGCFCLSALVLLISSIYGLQGCWFTLAVFQWARFSVALLRLLSPTGILYSEEASISQKLRTA